MKVLILSASTGGGHNRASNALKEYILSRDSNTDVEILDAFEACSKLINLTLTKGYHMLATKMPAFYGVVYNTADRESPISELVTNVSAQCAKKVYPIIRDLNPDIIISCHPFATQMMSTIKEKFDYRIPVISILTDFMPHRAYICDNIDAYITASGDTARVLSEKYDIDKTIIHDFGLPVFERFYQNGKEQQESAKEKLGLEKDKKTILIMAGSFGVTDILNIYERLVDIDTDFQIIVITGKNKRLYNAFEQILSDAERFEAQDMPEHIRNLSDENPLKLLYETHEQLKHNIKFTYIRSTTNTKPTKLFYFVDNVEDFMHAADLIITKPGGLTTSESIASRLPMVLFKSFPGQESQNADFLVEKGVALSLKKGEDPAEKINNLLKNPEKLQDMKDHITNIERRNSCEKIYDLIVDMLEKRMLKKQTS